MIFQSIAGSEKGNRAFGFSSETVEEALALLRTHGTAAGPNVMYFETGQGVSFPPMRTGMRIR